MKSLSRFEANLLLILRFFLRRVPVEQALPLVTKACPRPPCLSRDAVELVQDTLAKGCMTLLARSGGWRRERFLRGERISEGRLWERTDPQDLGLVFSGHTLRLLLWITAAPMPEKMPRFPPGQEMTPGDRFLLYLAYSALRETPNGAVLQPLALSLRHGLCWLAFPEDFAGAPQGVAPSFDSWTNGPGACMMEVLQAELAGQWRRLEQGKGQITNPQAMRTLGQAQERVLTAFLEAVERASRFDLARFLLQAAATLLSGSPNVQAWVGGLKVTGLRLAERVETYRAALVLLRQMDRLRDWDRLARAVGYLDEGYAAAQLWKADWEHWQGETLYARARDLIRELEF